MGCGGGEAARQYYEAGANALEHRRPPATHEESSFIPAIHTRARPSAPRGMPRVTCHDYNVVMSNVRIADLKAHLSEHLRSVRNGGTLTVFDRDTPVARIVPYSA